MSAQQMWSKQQYGEMHLTKYEEGGESFDIGLVAQEMTAFGGLRGNRYTAAALDDRKRVALGAFASRKEARQAVEEYWKYKSE